MGLISRVSSRTYREQVTHFVMSKRQIFNISRRAFSSVEYKASAEHGRYSLDNTSSKGLSYIWNVKDGEEMLHFQGCRNDANQFYRQYTLWNYASMHPQEVGLLRDDCVNEDMLRRDPVKCRVRVGDESTQQWLYRWWKATDLSAAYDVLPRNEQPNDADHYYLRATVYPQIKAEYEEQHLIEEVTNQYDDTFHRLRNAMWFLPTRILNIVQEKNRAKATVGEMNAQGEIEKRETIGASLSRSAF